MKEWQMKFAIICERMRCRGETKRRLLGRGIIVWCPDLECPNCGSKGTFYGDELEYGAFYECAFARYCPACKMVYDVIEGKNFAAYRQERFLPIMKRKLLANPQLRAHLTKNKGACPVCGGDTYTFHKDLGVIDYYDNYWTVCVNPNCGWPGTHHEEYEQGPYG
ncbi:MAG: hypothetical protein RMK18_09800 [Armatimonadota bacterium]|nr:hypothetical protein [Armatimonadota bacterium]MCX7777971.1 hypothetical protein [Armatimonadota bacterium]MDW8026136.1 hypothetical protein [Armatimonadota bacterium]